MNLISVEVSEFELSILPLGKKYKFYFPDLSMKSLKPSLREKKRYLFVKGNVQDIERAILSFVGILGMSKTALAFIKKERDSAIISINREALNEVRASLVVWPEKIEVLRVSGTLKGLRAKI